MCGMSGANANVVLSGDQYTKILNELKRLEAVDALALKLTADLTEANRRLIEMMHDADMYDKELREAREINEQLQEQLAEANEDNAILYNATKNLLRKA